VPVFGVKLYAARPSPLLQRLRGELGTVLDGDRGRYPELDDRPLIGGPFSVEVTYNLTVGPVRLK